MSFQLSAISYQRESEEVATEAAWGSYRDPDRGHTGFLLDWLTGVQPVPDVKTNRVLNQGQRFRFRLPFGVAPLECRTDGDESPVFVAFDDNRKRVILHAGLLSLKSRCYPLSLAAVRNQLPPSGYSERGVFSAGAAKAQSCVRVRTPARTRTRTRRRQFSGSETSWVGQGFLPATWPRRMSAPLLRQIGQCHGCEREHEYEYDYEYEYEQEEEKRGEGEGDGMPRLPPLRISTRLFPPVGRRRAEGAVRGAGGFRTVQLYRQTVAVREAALSRSIASRRGSP